MENDYEGDGRRFYTDGHHVHEFLKELVHDTQIEDMITVGEMSSTSLENCIRYSNPDEKELSMCFNFHHLKVDYKNGDKWELMEPDRKQLKDLFRTWQEGMQQNNGWNAVFWCNHDQPRIVSRLGDEGAYWKESAKMLAACTHLMRGTPYIYQGEELGMTNPHYTSIGEYKDVESLNYYRILLERGKSEREALEILAARSRDNGRSPVQWSADANAGFSDACPWISLSDNWKEINAEAQMQDETSVLAFYRQLISLRKSMKIIQEGEIHFILEEEERVLAYERTWEKEHMTVLNNLSSETIWMDFPDLRRGHRKILGNYDGLELENEKLILRPYETITLYRD